MYGYSEINLAQAILGYIAGLVAICDGDRRTIKTEEEE